MDPVIDQLRRAPVPEDDDLLSSGTYSGRFVLDYLDTTPVKVETAGDSTDLYGELETYDALLQARRDYGQTSNYQRVRLLANPFEGISTPFLNRAASKMASIVHAFPQILPAGADVVRIGMLAEAPGSMLEYLMWHLYRRGSAAEVTAISLEAGLPWDVSSSVMPGVNQAAITILKGKDETGDLTVPDNISAYRDETLRRGERDLVVADGGVGADENPEREESLNAALILGEVLGAIQVLRVGGSFVLKLYDAYSRFMADVLQLLAVHFRQSTLFKPLTSRPANAERYYVGTGFTGLHLRSLKDAYLVLTLASSHATSRQVSQFLPAPPPLISDWIVRLNQWHALRQLSFLRWAIKVDEALVRNSRSRPNYPISYDLSRWYDLVGVPYSRSRQYLELSSSPCEEVRLIERVSQLAMEVTRSESDTATGNRLLELLFSWLRYSVSTRMAATADEVLRWDPDRLEEWSSYPTDKALRERVRALLLLERAYDDGRCPAMDFVLLQDGERRQVRGEVALGVANDTIQVTRGIMGLFLTQRERGRKSQQEVLQLGERKRQLERAFIFLKRYEALKLNDNAFRITYPVQVDVDLYATLLTRSSDAFYSPVVGLEAPFGAIGIPLGSESPPEGTTLALNLVYASDPKLRDDLIQRSLRLLDTPRTLYVATLLSIPQLDSSPHKRGQPEVLPRDRVVDAITGRQMEKRVLLYRLSSVSERPSMVSTVTSITSTTSNRPTTTSNRPTTTSNRPTTTSNRPTTTSNRPTTANRPATSNGPSTANRPATSNRPTTTSTTKGKEHFQEDEEDGKTLLRPEEEDDDEVEAQARERVPPSALVSKPTLKGSAPTTAPATTPAAPKKGKLASLRMGGVKLKE
jgi:23S rRNA U2552 (ribose-2'-O)-methylase RlmE/FtsJ